MAQELDSQMLQRLQENYREMSDGELLGLAAQPEDLTETAREVLRGEMAARGLKAEDAEGDPFAALKQAGLVKVNCDWLSAAPLKRSAESSLLNENRS